MFFYVGLGFAMMTSIVSIFEVSTTIRKNHHLTDTSISRQEDKLLIKNQNDKIFLKMLGDLKGISLGSGEEICQNIKDGLTNVSNTNYSILSNYSILNNYSYGVTSSSTHPRLNNGCSLIYDSHRIIIVPSSLENNHYNLYSCNIDIEPKCTFEIY